MAVVASEGKKQKKGEVVSFSKLKKDLLFHEKRLQLLGGRVVEDLESHLHEKSLSRQECRDDCGKAIKAFEVGAADAALSGRWDEHKVAKLFGLEVPLDLVVGSSRFEAPAVADCNAIGAMIKELQVIGRRFPEFSMEGEEDMKSIDVLMNAINDVSWGARDVSRMKEAVSAKVAVLTDLNELANELQQSNFDVAQLQSQLESLRRAEERAIEDGEMAVCDSIVREKLSVLSQMMQLLMQQCNFIAKAEETNVTKRRSNIAVFQGASAMLEVLKQEKAGFVAGCKKDLARIERGVQYEDRSTGSSRQKTREELDQSMSKIQALDARQQKLSNRLLEIFQDWKETEEALEQVGAERGKAVAAHVQLVEDSRHVMSDMIELKRFADVYAANLDKTHVEYQRGLDGLAALDQVLLQKKGFDNYDFNASARRLTHMNHNTAVRLNKSMNDYERQAEELQRKFGAQLRALDEEVDYTECEVEMKKDTFAPETKKYVSRARELRGKRENIGRDLELLTTNLEQMKAQCMETITQHLSQQEIENVEERNAVETLQRREDLVDMRQKLLQPRDDEVLGERSKLMVEKQSSVSIGTRRARSPQTRGEVSEETPQDLVVADGGEAARGGVSSKVLSVRDEVEKSKKLLMELEAAAAATEEQRQQQLAQAAAYQAAGLDANGQKPKRKIRTIPSELPQ